jgi:hypothetical protein
MLSSLNITKKQFRPNPAISVGITCFLHHMFSSHLYTQAYSTPSIYEYINTVTISVCRQLKIAHALVFVRPINKSSRGAHTPTQTILQGGK